MSSKVENSSRLHGQKSSVHKKPFFDKEKENQMPGVSDGKVTEMNFKARKQSESSFDRKGLQELESSNGHVTVPKRRIYSTGDLSGPKPYIKTRFQIFDDAQDNKDQRNEKLGDFKPTGTEKSRISLYLQKTGRNNAALTQKSKENYGKSSRKSSISGKPAESPNDLPPIIKSYPCKIKEDHKKASTKKKTLYMGGFDYMSLQLAYNTDYMHEYVRFQMELHGKKQLPPNFLSNSLTADQRRCLVRYLIKTAAYYKYPSYVLYQAVKIFDSYINGAALSLEALQPAALAAFWIASKKDLITIYIPEASEIMELGAGIFEDKRMLLEWEKKILTKLNFDISFDCPFSMWSLYTVIIDDNLISKQVQELYYCGSYLIDLSLLHDKMYDLSAVHLASIIAEIVFTLFTTDDLKNLQWNHWRNRVLMVNPTLDKFPLRESQIDYVRNQLLQKVMLSKDKKLDYYIVYRKYNSKRYGPVSKVVTSKISSLFLQKICDPVYDNQPIAF